MENSQSTEQQTQQAIGNQNSDDQIQTFVSDLIDVLPKDEEIKENGNQNETLEQVQDKVLDLVEVDQQQDEDNKQNEEEEQEQFQDAVDKIEQHYDVINIVNVQFIQLAQARQLKEKANEDFKMERYDECIRLYDQAIQLCPPEEITDLSIFHNNKGICYTKLKQNKEAKKEFSRAIEIKPDYVKPRAFRMKIFRDEEEYDQALEDAKKIEELEPLYPQIHRTVLELDKLQKEKFEKMKNEVLGNLKSFGNTILGKFGMSLDNFKLNQNPDGTYNINYQNQ